MSPLASNLFKLFVSADIGSVCTLTLLLIGLFFAAWKAPAWVKEIGLASFAAGLLWTIIGFIEMGKVISECAPDVDLYIVWAAVPCALIPAAYGTVVYIISLIIRILRKPRI